MHRRSKLQFLLILLILAVASFFRFYQLDKYPPGLYPDEAMNGSNALVANATGRYQIFYPENNGREGLFINIQAISVKYFGNNPWALRGVSAVFGILTVLGLFLLARELFSWQIGAISSFLLAISFWHVNFSRIGFRAIMLPFVLVYVFYFLWRGLRSSHYKYFFWAGIFGGLGFCTYTSYRVAPLIAILVFINYWLFLKKDYGHDDYLHVRNRFLGGFCLMAIVVFLVALPIGVYFLNNPENFMARNYLSVFAQPQPLDALSNSIVKTLGMFTFAGDNNARHNIPGAAMLGWPIAVLFAVGFIKELIHWLRRKHGHLSSVHTLMFAWFFVMLLPGFLSIEAPHALRTIGVLPIVMIFAARGLWWLFHAAGDWEMLNYPWENRGQFIAPTLATLALLGAVGLYEYNRYFNVFGPAQITQSAFTKSYVDVATKINALPISVKKYVIIEAPAIKAYGLPVSAETVMFLTDTVTAQNQKSKNLVYITPDQLSRYRFGPKDIVFRIQ